MSCPSDGQKSMTSENPSPIAELPMEPSGSPQGDQNVHEKQRKLVMAATAEMPGAQRGTNRSPLPFDNRHCKSTSSRLQPGCRRASRDLEPCRPS